MSVIEDNWDYQIDLINVKKKSYNDFECQQNNIHSKICKHFERGFKTQKFTYNGNAADYQDEEWKGLIENNKDLRHQIEEKLKDISRKQFQYETYKKEQKLLTQQIKETHEAHLMAKKYYKKFLKMYFTVEARNGDQLTIFVQFFTEAKKDSENYSIRLQKNTKTGLYQLLSTTPKLPCLGDLKRKLQETNDVAGTLCLARQAFIDIKASKK